MTSTFLKGWRRQTLHHRLMLVMALPMTLWVVSGCYFVWLDLGYIRGDHYQQPTTYITVNEQHVSFAELASRYPDAQKLDLTMIAQQPYYRVYLKKGTVLVDANTGAETQTITQQQATDIATSVMPNDMPFTVKKLLDNAPSELSTRHLPVWQVSFNDRVNTSIYVSASSGDIVARRHDFWRTFDIFWRIHIMDYDDGANVGNWLLFVATILALVAVISGILWQSKWWRRGRL